MKKILSLGIFLVLVACLHAYDTDLEERRPLKGSDYVYQVLKESATLLEQKHSMQTCATVIGMPEGSIRKIGLEFQVCGEFSKDRLRHILIDSAEEMVRIVDAKKEIKKFLHVPPFGIQNVEITLYVQDGEGHSPCDPEICVASIARGLLTYKTDDPDDPYTYKGRYEESYEEAVALLSGKDAYPSEMNLRQP